MITARGSERVKWLSIDISLSVLMQSLKYHTQIKIQYDTELVLRLDYGGLGVIW